MNTGITKIIDSHLHLASFYKTASLDLIKDDISYGLFSYLAYRPGEEIAGNEAALAWQEKSLGKFFALAWVNPLTPRWIDKIKPNVAKIKGLKIHPEINNYPVDINTLGAVFEFANKYQLPITTHTGKKTNPRSFHPLVKRYPEVKLLLAHMTPLPESLELAQKNKNVFLETSHTDPKIVLKAFNNCGQGKIVFGSDFPALRKYHIPFEKRKMLYQEEINFFTKNKNLTLADKKSFLFSNAAKIFSL